MKEHLIKTIDSYGNVIFVLNGELHREDGPAVTLPDGTEFWLKEGSLHRTDGPAVIQSNSKKQWWIEGINYTEEDFNNKIKEYK
jgi:hypothetical protein